MFIRMRVIEITIILLLFVTLLAVAEQLDAWGEGGRDISSQNSRSTWQETKDYVSGVMNGAMEMHRAYNDMKEANWKNSDKYFHARGNADAAKHGTGGRHAAKVIRSALSRDKMSKQAGDEKERIPCDVCGVTFKTERYLKVHKKKFHEKGKIAESEKNEKEELVELQSSDSDWDVDPEICLEDDMLDVTSGRDESGNKSESNVICLESSSDNIKCDGNKLKTKSKSIKGILRMQTKPTLFVPKRKCPMMELSKDMFKKQKVLTSQTKAVTSQTKVGTIQKNNVTTEKEENLINIDCELNLETDGRSTHEMTIKSESKKVFQSFETITSGANQREQTISLGDYLPKGMNIKPEDVVIRRIITEGKCVLQMEMMCKKA